MTDEEEDGEEAPPAREPSAAPIPPELVRGYTTLALPAISARARVVLDDFRVEEVPLYEPCGKGEHAYALVEKRGIPTLEAIRRLSRALGVPAREVGYAGLKDARAITRQTLSFPAKAASGLASFKDDSLTILSVKEHGNKLKLGHLKGNRFVIRLRDVSGEDEARARDALALLARKGAPNYFGLQRFGQRRNSHRLGLALVREDASAFLKELLGSPSPDESPRVRSAREAFEKGEMRAAREALPPSFEAERSALASLERSPGDPARAVRAIAVKWRRLYASALQSMLFNRYLARRLDRIDRLEAGEVAFLHRNGAAFVVADAAVEQARADAHEISPSGPIFGQKLLRPAEGSRPRADEDSVLAESALAGPDLGAALGASPRGERRSLRVLVTDASVAREGEDLVLRFFLPRGCYATSVLEELTKRPVD